MKPYNFAIVWIAGNDEPENTDLEFVSSMISVILVADLYEKKIRKVAQDVIDYRTGNITLRFARAQERSHKRTAEEAKRIQEQRIRKAAKQVQKDLNNLKIVF